MPERFGVRSLRAVIRGRVQGLGFRPFVFRLAQSLGIAGYVANTGRGVVVLAQGGSAARFLAALRDRPPALARISSFRVARVNARRRQSFTIRGSLTERAGGVDVLPDLAICADCGRDIAGRTNRRFGYAFTNCTQCGPRYTIIESLPYDRPRTTMRGFKMCPDCGREYSDPADRRFHAQPNACPVCGPQLAVPFDNTSRSSRGSDSLLIAARAILAGNIVAVKSLGGYQLACDALSATAVARLRRRKHRPAKPLALMCDTVATIRRFCRVSPEARNLLLSPAAPIVLMPKRADSSLKVAGEVAPGNPNLGVMLAYTPLHLELFRRLRRLTRRPAVLVMTSANRKDEPIAATEQELSSAVGIVPDLVLTHNRPIANRLDDSVVFAERVRGFSGSGIQVARQPTGGLSSTIFVRRARGYAPLPIELAPMFHVKHPVLAVGPEFKNTFCLARGARAFVSPHIGTVETPAGERFWLDTLERYEGLTGIKPEAIACDLHPDYASTRLAERLSRTRKLPLVRVQHHFAHTLSVLAEHGLPGPVLGLAFDGTGYGTDGAIWGCEFLLVQADRSWSRIGQLGYLRLANAGAEVANPSRVAREYLRQTRGAERQRVRGTKVSNSATPSLYHSIPQPLPTSSLGRLFDAVAAITGICRSASFDGQAAIALEAAAEPGVTGDWFTPDLLDFAVSPAVIRPELLLRHVSRETSAGAAPGRVAARFHNTVARCAVELACFLCEQRSITTVCLSGGSFQNTILRRSIVHRLSRAGLAVYVNQQVPVNDGGISLGQVAAATRNTKP
jgi:hydrogenase maturation protein HypF